MNHSNLKPQDRDKLGDIDFVKNGSTQKADRIWSIPCDRCDGCPLYKTDLRTVPTSYYCQVGFYSVVNVCSFVERKLIPNTCQILEINRARVYGK